MASLRHKLMRRGALEMLEDAGRLGASDSAKINEDHSAVFQDWGSNFVELGHPYEKYEAMTEEEYIKLGEDWIAKGAQSDEATFRFHPEELRGMLYALRGGTELVGG